MAEVPIVKISYTDRGKFARDVYGAATYNGLPHESAIILTAHIAGSTGWGKSVDNWRLAGMKADATWRATKDYTVVTGCECVAGLENKNDPKCVCAEGKGQQYNAKSYWRSFASLNESLASILDQLRATRYASAYALLLQGDTEYLAEVGRNGWYTADPAYIKSAYGAHITKIREYVGETQVASSIVVPVALAIGYLIWKRG